MAPREPFRPAQLCSETHTSQNPSPPKKLRCALVELCVPSLCLSSLYRSKFVGSSPKSSTWTTMAKKEHGQALEVKLRFTHMRHIAMEGMSRRQQTNGHLSSISHRKAKRTLNTAEPKSCSTHTPHGMRRPPVPTPLRWEQPARPTPANLEAARAKLPQSVGT